VGRLSARDVRTARDWAEFARETVTWGRHIQDDQRAVPEGPVRDALTAVELGSALDKKTGDWDKLREELEALLRKPDEKKQNQQQKQQQQNQDQQKQDQQKQDSSQPEKSPEQKNQQQQQPSPENKKPSPQGQKPAESAFGDMKERTQPPPPSRDTQKVGGAPEKQDADKTPLDPSLTLPLQKLDQLRNQDSPAELFQLMDAKSKTETKKTGKDW
jgi:Ca-activated chloride channel family protein